MYDTDLYHILFIVIVYLIDYSKRNLWHMRHSLIWYETCYIYQGTQTESQASRLSPFNTQMENEKLLGLEKLFQIFYDCI